MNETNRARALCGGCFRNIHRRLSWTVVIVVYECRKNCFILLRLVCMMRKFGFFHASVG